MSKMVIPGVGPEFMAREGLVDEVQPWEDGLRADVGPGSFEWWYFDAHLDDGSTAVVSYATKPLLQRNDPLTPMLALTITPPDGRKRSSLKLLPPGQFHAGAECCAVAHWAEPLREFLGPAARGAGAETAGNGRALALRGDGRVRRPGRPPAFTGTVPPWRPGAGKNYYASDLSRYFALAAGGPVRRVQRRAGCTTARRTGHRHGLPRSQLGQHWARTTIMSHWVWGRGACRRLHAHLRRDGQQQGVRWSDAARVHVGEGRPHPDRRRPAADPAYER